MRRSKARIDHLTELSQIPSVDSPQFIRWNETRLNRLLVDYMLRSGHLSTAEQLANQTGIKVDYKSVGISKSVIQKDLVDVELFVQGQKIEGALAAKSCSEGLQWCSENKSGLKRLKVWIGMS